MLVRLKNCIKIARFSTQKSKIKFDFKPIHEDPIDPKKVKQPSINQSKNTDATENSNGGLVRITRKQKPQSVAQAAPQYKDNQQSISNAQKAYMNDVEKRIQQNEATRNFYEYEIKRGEDLIDNMPINPYYQYKKADLNYQLQQRKKLINQFKKIQTLVYEDKADKLAQFKNIISGYQTMKHRYQLQEFYKQLQKYPGGIKGPRPQDDPQEFNSYVNKIIPDWVRNQIMSNNKKQANSSIKQDQSTQKIVPLAKIVSDYLTTQPKMVPEQNQQQQLQKIQDEAKENLQNIPYLMPYDPVPALPYTNFQQYHTYMGKLNMWAKFRKTYDIVNQKQRQNNMQQTLNEVGKGYDQQNSNKIRTVRYKNKKYRQKPITFKPRIYSLYTYYKTLPKQIQQHPAVRTVYLGLQYCSPDLNYQRKQQLLNMAAKYALPMDNFSTQAMRQLIKSDRKLVTPHIFERVFNINPQFTWDIQEFLNQVKNEKLRSISTVKQKQEHFHEPPQVFNEMDPGANLPVDFYDNQDGFWDQHIDKKLKRYQSVHPLSMKPKKYLQH